MSIPVSHELFHPDAVFVTNQTSQAAIFQEVAAQLRQLKAVKPGFAQALLAREHDYPTGIDLSVLNSDYPNVAVPHTEAEFVNTRMIVPIKLMHPVMFGNMIDPSVQLPVSYLFMLLNDELDSQTNILAQVMDLITTTPTKQLTAFFNETNRATIYSLLSTYFSQD